MRKLPPPQGQDIVEERMERLKRTVAKLTSGHDRTAAGLSTQDQASQHSIIKWEEVHEPNKVLDKLEAYQVNGFWGRRVSISLTVLTPGRATTPQWIAPYPEVYEQQKLKLLGY